MYFKYNKWFSLIELLVVITIIAIISVVAYTNFSGSTDKAKNSRKLSDLSSIETGLQHFYQEKNYYPMPSEYNSWTNVWWYSWWTAWFNASMSNTFTGAKSSEQIMSVSWSLIRWWGIVYDTGWTNQVWAKWVIDSSVLGKQYLSQELFDPSLKEIKVWNDKVFKDYWIWKYTYSIYAKPAAVWSWNTNSQKWQAYNLAITLYDEQKTYITKIIWNFDKTLCNDCPESLIWIWSGSVYLKDWDAWTWSWVDSTEQWIPYPINWF